MNENFEIVRIQDVQEGTEQALETLNLPAPTADELNPALAYLISLPQRLSQQTMAGALILAAWTLWQKDPGQTPTAGTPEGLRVLRIFPWGEIRAHHIYALRARLRDPDPRRLAAKEGYSDRQFNKVFTAIRQVAMKARSRKLMPFEACDDILQIKRLKVFRLPAGAIVPYDDIAKLCVEAGKQKPNLARRDLAAISLLMLGMRRAEVASVRVEKYTTTIRVTGKGNKERELPVSPLLRVALDAWIEIRGHEPGPILLALTKHDTVNCEKGLVPQTILDIVKRLARRAGLGRVPSPHDFRRTFITKLLDGGLDLLKVAELAGHANVETTKIYDRRGMEAKQKATDALDAVMRESGINFEQ